MSSLSQLQHSKCNFHITKLGPNNTIQCSALFFFFFWLWISSVQLCSPIALNILRILALVIEIFVCMLSMIQVCYIVQNLTGDLIEQIQVIGSYGGRARQDLPKLVRLAETGIFNLSNAVTRKYKLEEAGQAFDDLNQGKIVSRAVIEIRQFWITPSNSLCWQSSASSIGDVLLMFSSKNTRSQWTRLPI